MYDAAQWSDLFVASAGAAAALAGLVFVAVSINLAQILRSSGLPARAAESLLFLVGVLIVSLLCLAEGQGRRALGIELLVEGVLLVVTIVVLFFHGLPRPEERGTLPPHWLLGRTMLSAMGSVPFLVGGVSLLAGSGGGLYWTFAGIIAAFAASTINAWVLLVEIQR